MRSKNGNKWFIRSLSAVLLLIGLFLPRQCFSASAAESVSFSTGSVSCAVNRLIEVPVYAQSGNPLSAALFSFSYDSGLLEFRGASAPAGSKVVYHETGECVKLSYLCADGAEISSSAQIFTLKFKSLRAGSCSVDFTVTDCVNAAVERISAGSCTAGQVTIGTQSARFDSGKSSKTSRSQSKTAKQQSEKTSKASGKSTSGTSEAEEIEKRGTINDLIEKDFDKTVPLVVLCASVVVAIMLAGAVIIRVTAAVKIKKRGRDEDEEDG